MELAGLAEESGFLVTRVLCLEMVITALLSVCWVLGPCHVLCLPHFTESINNCAK